MSRVVAVTTKGQRGEQSSSFLCPALSTTWLRTTDDAACSSSWFDLNLDLSLSQVIVPMKCCLVLLLSQTMTILPKPGAVRYGASPLFPIINTNLG